MGTYIDNVIDAYREQTVKLFTQANPNGHGIQIVSANQLGNANKELKTKDGLGEVVDHSNNTALLYNTGGLFADCCLEAPVLNTTLNPIYSLANIIPVRPMNLEKVRYAFLTSISEPGTEYPDYPCDPPPQVGDIDGAYAEFYPGRISYRTKTMELDALISKACRGISEDLYLVGSVRGVSAFPTQEQLSDRNFISRAAVRRQIQLIGRAMQRNLLNQLWTGDPTNATVNTEHGGWKMFWGLNHLIADDYHTDKDFVEGTNLESLNSDVKDFEYNSIGGATSLYNYMQALEDTIFQRAAQNGLLPVNWVWVMHPIIWSELVKHLPCEMLTDSCGYSNVTFTISADNGMGIQAIRQQMQNSMQISVNGRTAPVILDHSVPITKDGQTPPSYTSSIYYIPLTVAGQEVLYWTHRDYSAFDEVLSPIPGSADVGLRGWTDGGRFHFIVERSRRCFEVEAKAEFGLVFTAPWLAGRIDNVVANPLQEKPNYQAIPVVVPPAPGGGDGNGDGEGNGEGNGGGEGNGEGLED